jgi:hypothetical protein
MVRFTCIAGILFFLGVVLLPAEAVTNLTFGAKEVIYTAAQRNALGLNYWPDGNLGVVPDGSGGCYFYAANSTGSKRARGSLAAPGGLGTVACSMSGGESLNYKAGGPVYKDPASGRLLQFYHAEVHPGGDPTKFYSILGMAVSEASWTSFYDCGRTVQANMSQMQADAATQVVEMCGSPYIVKDGYFWVYYRDTLTNRAGVNLCVARAPVSSVVAAATNHASVSWQKYYNGSFSEPGLGGRSSPLETGNPGVRWMDIKWSSYLQKYVMVVSVGWPGPDLYLAFSDDGINWSARTRIENDPGESFYCSLVGAGADPQELGQSFYVYYTYSAAGDWNRWTDAEIVRRLVAFDGSTNTNLPPFDPLVCKLLLDEAAGSTAYDGSGHTNNGTLAGQAAWTSGDAGSGVLLDPVAGDDYVQLPDNVLTTDLQEGDYTVMGRFNFLSVPAGTGTQNNAAYGLVMKGGYHLGLKYQNNAQLVLDHWLAGNVWAGVAAAGTCTTGVFWHVAGVVSRSNGTVRIYVNGEVKGTATFTSGTAAREYGLEPWRIGVAAPGATTYRWPAHMVADDVRLYAAALPAETIAAIAADADEDDLPDAWERKWFGSLTNTSGAADADWDRDQFPDRHEYLAGTDPENPTSRLAFTEIRLTDGGPVLRWASETGRWYCVSGKTNLDAAGWTPVASNISAAAPVNVFTAGASVAAGYWRVAVE